MTRWKWKRPYYYFKSHILPIQDYRLGQPRMQTMMYTTISCVHHCIPIDVCIHINGNRVIVWMFSIPVPLFFLFPIFDSINMGKNGSKKVGTNVSVTKNMFNVNIMWKWNTNDCFSVQNLCVGQCLSCGSELNSEIFPNDYQYDFTSTAAGCWSVMVWLISRTQEVTCVKQTAVCGSGCLRTDSNVVWMVLMSDVSFCFTVRRYLWNTWEGSPYAWISTMKCCRRVESPVWRETP